MREKLIRSLKEKVYKNLALMNVFIPSVYVGNNTVLTRTIYGQKLFVDTQDLSLAPHLLLNRYWEKGVSDLFARTIKSGMHVVEVGSNFGYYSVLAASKIGSNGHIHSFEANPKMHKLLQKNMDINGFLSISSCTNKAVSDRAGTVKLKILNEHLGSSYICQEPEQEIVHTEEKVIEVESTSLDLELGEDYHIDLLKIDAEGAEPLIIKGASQLLRNNKNIKIILEFCIENFKHREAKAYLNSLRDLGFKINIIRANSRYKPISNSEILNNKLTQELFLFR